MVVQNSKLGIRARIWIGLTIILSIFILTLGGTWIQVSKLSDNTQIINTTSMPNALLAAELNLKRSDVQQFLTDVSATHDKGGFEEAQKSADAFLKNVLFFKELYKKNGDGGKLNHIQNIEEQFNSMYAIGKTMATTYIEKGVTAGNEMMKGTSKIRGFDEASSELMEQLDKFQQMQLDDAKAITETSQNAAKTILYEIIIGISIATLLSIIVGLWIVKTIIKPLKEAKDFAQRIAEGDLTNNIHVETNDEFGQLQHALKEMNDSLIKIVSNVRSGTEFITVASEEISSGNIDLSSRTENQASNLEETASSMEELTSTVKQNADSAEQARHLIGNTVSIAESGAQSVNKLVSTMESINASSKQMNEIINVINSIAFQTNLLALNAAVEAARAGENGRGFAVVAGEVRNLAQRSAAASKEIKTLIENSAEKIKQGEQLAKESTDNMDDIMTSFQLVNDIIGEIANASREQSIGIEQVNQTIAQIDSITQQNAALVEEAAAAAESLSEQASTLKDTVNIFKLDGFDYEIRGNSKNRHKQYKPAY